MTTAIRKYDERPRPSPRPLHETNESVLTILAIERQINDGLELSVRLVRPKEGMPSE